MCIRDSSSGAPPGPDEAEVKLGAREWLLAPRLGGRTPAGAPPLVSSSAMGTNGVRALDGGAE
eukprot:14969124-Alexandrium_andersonii.AAC.1